jgi:hypothetical protein
VVQRRVRPEFAAARANPFGLINCVQAHKVASNDLGTAIQLSEILLGSLEDGTRGTYACGFRSLEDYCHRVNLSSLPVDALTLCAWMVDKGSTIKQKSLQKYVCGIRFVHLTNGLEWTLSKNPMVLATLRGLAKKYPSSSVLQKVPLTFNLISDLCKGIKGWPVLSNISFDDLLWVTATCVAFFAVLRGGEFFTYPKASRPLLVGKHVNVIQFVGHQAVKVDIVKPKTRPELISIPAYASSSPKFSVLDPVILFKSYRARAKLLGLDVLGDQPAFQTLGGQTLSRDFMVKHAELLRAKSGLVILDSDGMPIKVTAASWRAGFVQSAREVGMDPVTIRNSGRWVSVSGPIPYTHDSTLIFHQAADLIRTNAGANHSAGGQFVSGSVLEHSSSH